MDEQHDADFRRLYADELDSLYRVALRSTRRQADAEDAVADAVLRAYRAWRQSGPIANPRAWLHRILHNVLIDRARAANRRPELAAGAPEELDAWRPDEWRADWRADPAAVVEARLDAAEVGAALDDLSESYRNMIVLADVEGFKYREIAEILGIPIGTVMSRLSRARNALRDALSMRVAGGTT